MATEIGGGRRDFFVSHAGPDTDWAEWIGQQLERVGYSVELDVWDWSAGGDFMIAMERAFQYADRVLAVWTPSYFTRVWSGLEGRMAFVHSQHRPGWLVPVVVEDCGTDIPLIYQTMTRINLVGLVEQEARNQLLRGLRTGTRPAGLVRFPAAVRQTEQVVFPRQLPPVWGPVPARNLLFTGRTDLLEVIAAQLSSRQTVAIAALQGMGGVGKTQLAIEYAWRRIEEYQAVWWVDAETPSGMTAGLADLGAALGVASGDLPTRAWAALAELGRMDRWLLVYDNVSDPGALAAMRPPPTGHLIVTSRDPTIRRLGVNVVEVAEFDRGEAIALLTRHAPTLPVQDADRLARQLVDLPLAVDQAGAYLAETGITVDVYLARLADQPTAVLAEATPHHPSLAATVGAAYRQLTAQHPDAAALLEQLAFLAPEPIPLAATGGDIGGSLAVGDPAVVHEMISAMARLALVRRRGTALQIHRLVQALLQARLSPDQARIRLTGALDLLGTAVPGPPQDPSTWPSYAALTPHAIGVSDHLDVLREADEPPTFRRLLGQVCWYLYCTGQHQVARALTEHTLHRWEVVLGADAPDTLGAATALTAMLNALGEVHTARSRDEDTLIRRRRVLGDDHPDTLISANNLALDLYSLGEHQTARELNENTLARFRTVLGSDHTATLASASNLARDLHALGENQAARELGEDTLARYRRVLDDDHPDTLISANNLACSLHELGHVENACELGEDTLTRFRRVLGDDHPHTLTSARNLTRSLRIVEQHEAARELEEHFSARGRQPSGDDYDRSPESARTLTIRLYSA